MERKIKTLLIGESWTVQIVETKGFDVFYANYYEEGINYIKPALTTDEIEFHHLPCHRISVDFPTTLKNLQEYDVILISDVGANTFLLPIETFLHGKKG